jgi:hypothetical protein
MLGKKGFPCISQRELKIGFVSFIISNKYFNGYKECHYTEEKNSLLFPFGFSYNIHVVTQSRTFYSHLELKEFFSHGMLKIILGLNIFT